MKTYASGAQLSSTHETTHQGLFSYRLMKGLEGDADKINFVPCPLRNTELILLFFDSLLPRIELTGQYFYEV